LRDFFKFAIAFVAEQVHAIAEANGGSCGRRWSKSQRGKPRPLPLGEAGFRQSTSTKCRRRHCAATTDAVIQRADKKQVRLAIAIEIEKACSGARLGAWAVHQ